MQITNSIVCDAGKGCIYKKIKPPLVGEHAFPLTGFVCASAHVTVLSLTQCISELVNLLVIVVGRFLHSLEDSSDVNVLTIIFYDIATQH